MPADAAAWKLFAFQQTINSTIPFLMITPDQPASRRTGKAARTGSRMTRAA
jgi:hypothetical protein